MIRGSSLAESAASATAPPGRDSLPQVVIIADDLTGAADATGYFAATGLTSLVRVEPGECLPADVVSISTNSRDLVEGEAVLRTRRAASTVRVPSGSGYCRWVLTKIDSTLRGHPGAELAAVMAELGEDRALVAPAFPAQGRTTLYGRQLVDGIPLDPTSVTTGIRSADLMQVFRPHFPHHRVDRISLEAVCAGPARVAELLSQAEPGVLIADATSSAHLETLARGAAESRVRILCGSAGLARALGRALGLRPLFTSPPQPRAGPGPVLVVASSRHPTTTNQVREGARLGAAVVQVAPGQPAGSPAVVDDAVGQAKRWLAHGRDVILTTVDSDGPVANCPHVAERLAAVARAVVSGSAVGGLVLTGGDTALAAIRALESSTIRLYGEVEPGIPWGVLWDGPHRGLPVVTKAGGFGANDALIRSIERLHAGGA